MRRVIVGKDDAIELALIALICKGHVLIEDVPGWARPLAAALSKPGLLLQTHPVYPDVTPSDVTGFTMYNMQTGRWSSSPAW